VTLPMRRTASQVTIAAVAFVLGLLVVAQLRAQGGTSALANLSSQELTVLVANLNTHNDQLRSEVSRLDRQLSDLETGRTRGETSVGEIRRDLGRIRAWAGLDPVVGPGIVISVTGSLAGPGLEDLVNELRNAGAEAISIEDVRVVPGTVIGGGPGQVSVDDRPLGVSFRILAIGTPETMIGSLTRTGGIVAQLAATFPQATLDVREAEGLLVPATRRDLIPKDGQPRL
jgi:uncharacterized protein YlxW (UPF0749 family)